VERLRVGAGRISFDGSFSSPHRSSVEVRIQGPSLRRVGLNGSGSLVLDGIDAEELDIDIRGSGSVEGSGTVRELDLRIFGSGNADLSRLAVTDVDASIFGSGDAELSVTGAAEVSLIGSGDVEFTTSPGELSTRVIGSGRVVQPPAVVAGGD